MRHLRALAFSGLIVCLLLSPFLPTALADDSDTPVDTECPEGLVYVPSSDNCLLPENVPPGEDVVTPTEPSSDESTQDDQDIHGDQGDQDTQDDQVIQEDQGDQDTQGDQDFQGSQAIANLTLQTFACSQTLDNGMPMAGTDPEDCAAAADPAPNYTILSGGTEVLTVPLSQDVDLGAMPAGAWTIRENSVAGFGNPYVQCQVTASDGSVSTPANGIVAGGVVDLTLGAGDVVSCRWWSQRAQSIQGIAALAPTNLVGRVVVTLCEPVGCQEEIPLPNPITVVVSYDGTALPSQQVSSADNDFTFAIPPEMGNGGQWGISLSDAPAQWKLVSASCLAYPGAGGDPHQPTSRPWVGAGLGHSIEVAANETWVCQLYLSESASVTHGYIRYHACPDTIDPAISAPADRDLACRVVEDTSTVGATASLDGNAISSFDIGDNILPGTMTIPLSAGTWSFGAGLAIRFVTCDHLIGQLNQTQTIEVPVSGNTSFSIETGEGDGLTCDVYLGAAPAPTPTPTPTPTTTPTPSTTSDPTPTPTPTPSTSGTTQQDTGSGTTQQDTGSGTTTTNPGTTSSQSPSAPTQPASGVSALAIQAWTCPGEADLTLPTADLMTTCTVTTTATTWLLGQQPLSAAGGAALWGNLPLGAVTVTYQDAATSGAQGSGVTCSMAPSNQAAIVTVAVPVAQGSIQLVFEQPASVYCNWFLQP